MLYLFYQFFHLFYSLHQSNLSIHLLIFNILLSPTNPAGPAPCHVYLTLPESTSDSMVVHFQTPGTLPTDAEPRIYYDTVSHANNQSSSGSLSLYSFNAAASTYVYRSMDITRSIHWIVLSGLKSSTGKAEITLLLYSIV